MDKKINLDLNGKHFVKYIKILIIGLLLLLEMLICAQYVPMYFNNGNVLQLSVVIICCFFLAVVVAADSFLKSPLYAKFVFFGVDSAILLVINITTGNSYMFTLYCIVLTQFYISINNFKYNSILFGISCALFVMSFVCGWVVVNKGASLYKSIIQIFGDCFIGISIIGIHYAVTNFVLKFYNNYIQLNKALKEADESKAQLKEVYEQLSRTAVFEERNRIAKDIHDNAGHSMTTVIMQTEAAKLLIDTNPQEAKNRIISANIQAKNALDQMRGSVHLFAGRTMAHSLKEEIEEIIAQTIDGTELKIRCDIDDVAVGSEQSRFVCNSVKESLANGIRHGKATAFYVELKKSLSGVSLLISDNGCGIEGHIREGFGLKGMREKAEALGGRIDFSSEAGEGFEVEISLPLNEV